MFGTDSGAGGPEGGRCGRRSPVAGGASRRNLHCDKIIIVLIHLQRFVFEHQSVWRRRSHEQSVWHLGCSSRVAERCQGRFVVLGFSVQVFQSERVQAPEAPISGDCTSPRLLSLWKRWGFGFCTSLSINLCTRVNHINLVDHIFRLGSERSIAHRTIHSTTSRKLSGNHCPIGNSTVAVSHLFDIVCQGSFGD